MLKHIALVMLSLISLSAAAEFSNESEVSMVVTGGNTEVQVYNAKTANSYKYEKNVFSLGGHYMYGTSSDVLSSQNWDVNGRYERILYKKLGTFLGVIYEGDKFAGIKSRLNTDLGASYHYLETQRMKGRTELGLRYREEESYSGTELTQVQGRVFAEIGYSKTKEVETKFWVEYLPNFTDSEDWQINFAPSFQYNFHSSLALKWSYIGKYDNLPVPGNKNFDFQYTTSLIAKF